MSDLDSVSGNVLGGACLVIAMLVAALFGMNQYYTSMLIKYDVGYYDAKTGDFTYRPRPEKVENSK